MNKRFAHIYETENGGFIVDYFVTHPGTPPRDELLKDCYESLDKVLKKLEDYFK